MGGTAATGRSSHSLTTVPSRQRSPPQTPHTPVPRSSSLCQPDPFHRPRYFGLLTDATGGAAFWACVIFIPARRAFRPRSSPCPRGHNLASPVCLPESSCASAAPGSASGGLRLTAERASPAISVATPPWTRSPQRTISLKRPLPSAQRPPVRRPGLSSSWRLGATGLAFSVLSQENQTFLKSLVPSLLASPLKTAPAALRLALRAKMKPSVASQSKTIPAKAHRPSRCCGLGLAGLRGRAALRVPHPRVPGQSNADSCREHPAPSALVRPRMRRRGQPRALTTKRSTLLSPQPLQL